MNAMFRVTYLLYVNTTTTHVTTPFAKKRFEKGFLAEIYSLCASARLLIYLHPIFSHVNINITNQMYP